MIIPLLMDPSSHQDAPWLGEFYRALQMQKREQGAIIADACYFVDPKQFQRLGRWESFAVQGLYPEPLQQDFDNVLSYPVPVDLYHLMENGRRMLPTHTAIAFIRDRQSRFEAWLNNVLDEIANRSGQVIEALLMFRQYASVDFIASQRNIKVFFYDCAALHLPVYRQMAYLDDSGFFVQVGLQKRFEKFCEEVKQQEIPYFNGKELLSLFLTRNNMHFLERYEDTPTHAAGIATQYSWFAPAYQSASNLDVIQIAMERFTKDQILLRTHPGDPSGSSYASFRLQQDTSSSPLAFILKCRTILSIASNMNFEAMLWGRLSFSASEGLYAFMGTQEADATMQACDARFLSYVILGFYLPSELLYEPDYLRWRIHSLPSETEIYLRHLQYYLNELALPVSLLEDKTECRWFNILRFRGYQNETEMNFRALNTKIDALTKENRELEAYTVQQNTVIADQGEQIRLLTLKVADYSTMLSIQEGLKEEIDMLKKHLQIAQIESDALQQQNHALQGAIKHMQEQIQALNDQIQLIRQQNDTLQQHSDSLQQQLHVLQAENNGLRYQLAQMHSERDALLRSVSYRLGNKMVKVLKILRADKVGRLVYRVLSKANRLLEPSKPGTVHSMHQPMPSTADNEIARINHHSDVNWQTVCCDDPITVVMYGDMPNLEATLQSLCAQTHTAWKLCILGVGHKKTMDRYAKGRWNSLPFSQDVLGRIGTPILFITRSILLLPEALQHFSYALRHGTTSVYADSYMSEKSGVMESGPILKPDYAPDYLRGTNYIGGIVAYSAAHAAKVRLSSFKTGFARAYDAALQAEAPAHIRLILFRELGYMLDESSRREGQKALEMSIARMGWDAQVMYGDRLDTYRVRQRVKGEMLVSIVIPTKDHIEELSRCVKSLKRSTYPHFEVIIVENNSQDPATFAYYQELEQDNRFHVYIYKGEGPFNISKINNYGVRHSSGDFIVLMNNDVEVINEDWMEIMLGLAQREDAGVVGAKLLYPDNTIQHGGMILLDKGWATHAHWHFDGNSSGYAGRLCTDQNYHSITTACAMIRRSLYDAVGGFTEELAEGYTDVDLCMKVRDQGFLVIWATDVVFYHYESVTRGQDDTPEKFARAIAEMTYYQQHWHSYYEHGDQYYSTAFKQSNETFVVNWEEL